MLFFLLNFYNSICFSLIPLFLLYILFNFNKIIRYGNDEVSENIKQIMECNIINIRFLQDKVSCLYSLKKKSHVLTNQEPIRIVIKST